MTTREHTSLGVVDRGSLPLCQTPGTVFSCFLNAARQWPDQPAIIDGQVQLSYLQLANQASCVASVVTSTQFDPSAPVALLLDSGPAMIAAMLGALQANRFYVPLDPGHPASRLAAILEDTTARILLTDVAHLDLAHTLQQSLGPAGAALAILSIDEALAGQEPVVVPIEGSPDSPVWLLYTSGSTGKPKGVVQTNRNVLQYVGNYAQGLQIKPGDHYALLFSCAVNAGAHVIFSTLLNGATLCVYDVRRRGLADLPAWLVEQQITLYASVPTLFRDWARALDSHCRFPALRYLMMIGEPVYARDLELFRSLPAPGCTLINRLGSTETGSILWHFCGRDEPASGVHVPVGRPVHGNEILLLDESGRTVPPEQIGEIVVRSRYLSPGYWRRQEVTARAFESDPVDPDLRLFHTGDLGRILPDGRYLCLGRRDFQIKVRGYRVEPGEVESALLQHPGVREAIVVGQADTEGETRLIAYYLPAAGYAPTVSELRRWLVPRVPEHMVPSFFVPLAKWPLAPNGKLDRRALPPPGAQRPRLDAPYTAPGTTLEQRLVELWQSTLHIAPIGVHDAFLDLGGNSILAMRLIALISAQFAVRVPVRTFFEAGTVAAVAALLESKQAPDTNRSAEQQP